jgi:UDP-2,3-diacylglucosamine hydrolase
LNRNGKIFFASDFHLGLEAGGSSSEREKRVVQWLERAATEASEIYLLGDVFDFWWEYRKVVPKGFTRFLGTLSAITDSGTPIHLFTGNHDMWMHSYLAEECGVTINHGEKEIVFNGKKFLLAHGEGLGTSEIGYKILLFLFRNLLIRKIFSAIHPRIGVAIGQAWSHNSRLGKGEHTSFLGEDKEDLLRYSNKVRETREIDYFIFGHRHLPMKYDLKNGGTVLILGDWISNSVWAEWDGTELKLVSSQIS